MSLVISNVGLNRILEVSVPVLSAMYPISIVLIILSFVFADGVRFRLVYMWGVFLTGAFSVLLALEQTGFEFMEVFLSKLPLYSMDLGWISPALFGILAGLFLNTIRHRGKGTGNI